MDHIKPYDLLSFIFDRFYAQLPGAFSIFIHMLGRYNLDQIKPNDQGFYFCRFYAQLGAFSNIFITHAEDADIDQIKPR